MESRSAVHGRLCC